MPTLSREGGVNIEVLAWLISMESVAKTGKAASLSPDPFPRRPGGPLRAASIRSGRRISPREVCSVTQLTLRSAMLRVLAVFFALVTAYATYQNASRPAPMSNSPAVEQSVPGERPSPSADGISPAAD